MTVAQFIKENAGYFTVFMSFLQGEETFESYIGLRRPIDQVEITVVKEEGEEIGSIAVFDQEEPGPRGGFLFDLYQSSDERSGVDAVLWMRTECIGTNEEIGQTLDEFFLQILPTMTFKPKRSES